MQMKKSVTLSFVLVSAWLLGGCQASAENTNSSRSDPSAAEDPSTSSKVIQSHQRLINLIKAGEQASNDNDYNSLVKVTNSLRQMGAQPITGTEDIAKSWTVLAEALRTDESTPPPLRGRIKGPAYRKNILDSEREETIEDIYYAAEQAELTLESMNGAPLTWSVYETDNLQEPICQSESPSNTHSCRFTPLWTAKYNIRIMNNSDQTAPYLFITN